MYEKEKLFLPSDFFGNAESCNGKNSLKECLMSTEIVELMEKPVYFQDVDDDDFYTFVLGYDIPTNFVGVENNEFNSRTINLLEKLNNVAQEQQLAQLIDYLIYEKYWATLNYDSRDRDTMCRILENYKDKIPIKNKAGQYIINKAGQVLLSSNSNKEEYNKFFIEQRVDGHYGEYISALGVMTPEEFIRQDNWFEGVDLDFVEYLYRQYGGQVENTNQLVKYLNDQLNDKLASDKRAVILKFIFECNLLSKMDQQLMNQQLMNQQLMNPPFSLSLSSYELVMYGEKINNLEYKYNCINLGGDIEGNKAEYEKIVCEEIIKEIFEELKFIDEKKLEDIRKAISIDNLVLCSTEQKDKPVGYTVLSDGKIYLWHQSNSRKYRECISKYIKNIYKIELDKRSYSMSAINTDYSIEVAHIEQDDLNQLLQIGKLWENELSWEDMEPEVKKRLLMEPYYFNKKFYPGYGKICPLCNKLVVTEITSMRIKSIYTEENDTKHKYDFICCNTCADLFYYCDNQPVIEGLENIDNLNSELELSFYLEPHYLYTPYSIKFKPRPVHRCILKQQKEK